MKKEVDVVKQLENKKYHKNYTPLIIVCIVVTFLIICSTVWVLLSSLAPAKLAGFVYRLNWNTYAVKLYEKDYKNEGNIDSLYMALNISIKLGNDEKVVELYEKFYDHDSYESYIEFVNSENAKTEASPMVKATLLNEDNYLKNSYIQSLINLGQDSKAFKFAVDDGLNMSPAYNNIGNYLFNNFCKSDVIVKFYDNFRAPVYGENMLVVDMYKYMEAVNTLFLANFQNQQLQTESWAMGNRVLQVGNNVLVVCEKLGIEETDGIQIVEETKKIMDNINQKFKYMTE